MFSLKEAKQIAANMSEGDEPYLVFRTPADAPCNQYPANIYNRGRYAICKASERAEYEAGGCEFVA